MNHTISVQTAYQTSVATQLRQFANVCKLRIGVTIAFTALAGVAVTPGASLAVWQMVVIGLAVLVRDWMGLRAELDEFVIWQRRARAEP